MPKQGFDIFVVDIALRAVFALASYKVGSRKGRDVALCAILGFLTGPIGLLVIALLKKR